MSLITYCWEAKFTPTHVTHNDFSLFKVKLEDMVLDAANHHVELSIEQDLSITEQAIVHELGQFINTTHRFATRLELLVVTTSELIQAWDIQECIPRAYSFSYDSNTFRRYDMKFNYGTMVPIQALSAAERYERAMKGFK